MLVMVISYAPILLCVVASWRRPLTAQLLEGDGIWTCTLIALYTPYHGFALTQNTAFMVLESIKTSALP